MLRKWMKRFCVVALFSLIIVTLVCWCGAGGYQAQVILSASMSPTIPAGSLVISRALPDSIYHPGDIVTFLAPTPGHPKVTHRITGFYTNRNGVEVATTKGDANTNGDSWTITRGNILGEIQTVIPWLGYIVNSIQFPAGFLFFCGLTFYLGIYPEFRQLFRRLTLRHT